MLPLYLLTSAKTKQIMVELKNGETYNGELINCDSWMNLTLKNVIQSSADGEKFLSIPEIYIRGMHIKYLRMPEEIMDHAKEQNLINMEQRNRNQKRRNFNGRDGQQGGQNRRFNQQRGGYNNNSNRRYNNQNNRFNDNQVNA
ncbi:U6 snRNA-associated Sm-like protein LSm4 [Diutina catenulata]